MPSRSALAHTALLRPGQTTTAMCNYTMLARHSQGYVLRCSSCEQYFLTFGTAAVTFNRVGFREFCREVNSCASDSASNAPKLENRFPIDIFSVNAMLVLDALELKALFDLLHAAVQQETFDDLCDELHLPRW